MLALREFGEFWWQAICKAFSSPLRFDLTGSPAVLAALRGYAYFRPIQDATMDNLTVVVPIAVFVATVVVGLAIGPWLLSRDAAAQALALRGGLESQVAAFQARVASALTMHYREGVRPYRQIHANDPIPGEYIRIGVKNTSEAASIEGVQARIARSEPEDEIFETNEPLENMGGAWHPVGRRINPGQDIYIQLVMIPRGGNRSGDVKIHYVLEALREREWSPLPSGTWDLTIEVSGAHTPTISELFRLVVDEDLPERANLTWLRKGDPELPPATGRREDSPF